MSDELISVWMPRIVTDPRVPEDMVILISRPAPDEEFDPTRHLVAITNIGEVEAQPYGRPGFDPEWRH